MAASTLEHFAAALSGAAPVPADRLVGAGDRRFAVYRNNVVVGLIRALETRFPAVMTIVGEEFFRAMAREFAFRHPPASPVLMHFGDDFPAFIDGFPPAGAMPYLGDVARIEAARTRAYHAADAPRLAPADFATVAPEALGGLTLALHPAVAVICSRHPVGTIYAMNSGALDPAPIEPWAPQDVLVDRPEFDVIVRPLAPGFGPFFAALAAGAPLGLAAAEATEQAAEFDLSASLADLIGSGIATRLGTTTQGSQS